MSRLALCSLVCAFLLLPWSAIAQGDEPPVVPLWPGMAPGAVGDTPADRPTLTIHLPAPRGAKPSPAMVICPGGGYRNLAVDHEGVQIAEWLNRHGVAAFMLKYRLSPRYQQPIPLTDAQRAIRMVRASAAEYKVDPARVGIIGFSAGGHLASTTGTHLVDADDAAADPIDLQSARPDWMVLCYPVISMVEPFTHGGSRDNLLGAGAGDELRRAWSSELQVTAKTPPTFFFHTAEDAPVPPENSLAMFAALRRVGVPAELHLFEHGQHGVGLAAKDEALSKWPDLCVQWMRRHGFIDR